jgi:predicted lipoprotein
MITRRRFLLQSSSALALGSAAFAGCKRNLTRADALSAIAQDVALPAIRALSPVDARLVEAIEALPAAPQRDQLAAPRAALAAAILAWERAYVFRIGPLVESNAFLRARFWPVRASSLHALLGQDDAIDAARVSALGVDVKGLFALERLLWERQEADANALLFELRPERARTLALALAKDVQLRAATAERVLGSGKNFVRSFAAGAQQSLSLLVTQLVESVEAIVTDRYERVLGLARNGRLKQGDLLGDFAQLSTEITCAALDEIRRLYQGRDDDGLGALVKQAAPAIDAHVRRALDEASESAQAIGGPLEQVVRRDASKIERARERAKALELAFKVELPSALSITLSIAAGDGD